MCVRMHAKERQRDRERQTERDRDRERIAREGAEGVEEAGGGGLRTDLALAAHFPADGPLGVSPTPAQHRSCGSDR